MNPLTLISIEARTKCPIVHLIHENGNYVGHLPTIFMYSPSISVVYKVIYGGKLMLFKHRTSDVSYAHA
jgi:hypothetical protein